MVAYVRARKEKGCEQKARKRESAHALAVIGLASGVEYAREIAAVSAVTVQRVLAAVRAGLGHAVAACVRLGVLLLLRPEDVNEAQVKRREYTIGLRQPNSIQ